jgi:hydroxylamine reductase
MPKITKDMKIGEVLQKYPQVGDIMVEYGMHCAGCPFHAVETIEQGVAGHQMTEEKLNEMLEKMNKLIED